MAARGGGQWRVRAGAGHLHPGAAQHPQDPEPLTALAAHLGTDSESIVRLTAEKNTGGKFTGAEADYVNGVFTRSQALLPAGLTLHLNGKN